MKPVTLGPRDTERLALLYADAFSGDVPLMKTYKLRPRDFPGFFRVLHSLFFSGKPVKVIGLEREGMLLSATTLIGSDFRMGPRELLSAMTRSILELGWLRARWFWFMNLYQASLSLPSKPCWRLLFIGTRMDCIGRGLGQGSLGGNFQGFTRRGDPA